MVPLLISNVIRETIEEEQYAGKAIVCLEVLVHHKEWHGRTRSSLNICFQPKFAIFELERQMNFSFFFFLSLHS